MNTQQDNSFSHENHGADSHSHGGREDGESLTIYINTRATRVSKATLSYQELVELAYPGDVPNAAKVYEITYSSPHGPDGKLGVDGKVTLKEGMVCHVGLTNRS